MLTLRWKKNIFLYSASHEVSEAALLREIIYIFQGIEGKVIKLEQTNDAYRIDSKLGVPKAVRDLVNKLAELGWLFRKIRKYLDAHAGDKAMGLVGQSFCAALQQELTEYYRLLAVLEGQHQVGDAGFVGEGASGSLTLRRLMVWTYDPLMRLRTLAALVDACKGNRAKTFFCRDEHYWKNYIEILCRPKMLSPVRSIQQVPKDYFLFTYQY